MFSLFRLALLVFLGQLPFGLQLVLDIMTSLGALVLVNGVGPFRHVAGGWAKTRARLLGRVNGMLVIVVVVLVMVFHKMEESGCWRIDRSWRSGGYFWWG